MKVPKKMLFIVLAIVIAASMGSVFSEQLAELGNHDWDADWTLLGWALFHAFLYRIINTLGWVFVVWALRYPMPVLTGIRLWLKSEAFRWLPGSLWAYGSRIHLAKRHGLNLAAGSISVSVEAFLTVGAWMLSALLTIGWLQAEGALEPYLELIPWRGLFIAGAIGLLLILGLLLLHKRLQLSESAFAEKVSRFLRDLRYVGAQHPSTGGLFGTLCYYTLLCLYNGFTFWLILNALGLDISLPQAIAANSISWIIGFIAIFAPGGIGVREGVMVALLMNDASTAVLAVAVILWRLIQIITEAGCLLPFLLSGSPKGEQQQAGEGEK